MSNGNIMNVETTGANVPQDNLGYSGVAASHTMAQHDAAEMEKHRSKINKAAQKHGIEPALVAGVISRETRGGAAIRGSQGWGDHGKAWGLMQVDVTPNGGNHRARGGWDSDDHLDQATGILADSIRQVDRKYPHWTKEQKLKGGIAAYNAGGGRVTSLNVDQGTTGGDYSNDVVARAQWYKSRGGF